ncbi:MAG: TorF family putative porin [Rubrivivax sp.]|jgi:hypothetical protein
MRSVYQIQFQSAVILALGVHSALAQDIESVTMKTEVEVRSDMRNRGVSESLLRPGARAAVLVAHESGLTGFGELSSVSTRQYLRGRGSRVTLAGGYRFGDPDGWHFGIGLAADLYPGASFDAPHSLDPETFAPTDFRRTNYNSSYAGLEIGWGALETRISTVTSKNFVGASTGGVCGTLAQFSSDPTATFNCFGRGDQTSRGSWLIEANYKFDLGNNLSLTVHAGRQIVRNFPEASYSDYSLSMAKKIARFELSAQWLGAKVRTPALFVVQEGDRLRRIDKPRGVLVATYKF